MNVRGWFELIMNTGNIYCSDGFVIEEKIDEQVCIEYGRYGVFYMVRCIYSILHITRELKFEDYSIWVYIYYL